MPRFVELAKEYKGRARFVIVYCAEAHAQDEWPISSSRFNGGHGVVRINQHKNIEERTHHASLFRQNFFIESGDMLIDPCPENPYMEAYACWPLRIHIVAPNSRLAFVSDGPNQFLDDAENALLKVLGPNLK